MKIYEIVTPVAPPIKPGTPPTAVPGTPPPPAVPGTPPTAAPVKPGTPPPPAAPGTPPPPAAPGTPPAAPTPKMQQDLKSMSDQFTALKLKYDQLQKQILTPQA